MKSKFYVSFGCGTLLKGTLLPVVAQTEEDVRGAANSMFKNWCSIYSDNIDTRHMIKEFNLTLLPEVEI